jgi:hypothetical protein
VPSRGGPRVCVCSSESVLSDPSSSSSTQGLKFDVVVSKFDENLDKSQFVGGAGERTRGRKP